MTHPLFDPANDLSVMLAAFHSDDPDVRAFSLQMADDNCRASGHQPVSIETQLQDAVGRAIEPDVHAGDTVMIRPAFGADPAVRVTVLSIGFEGGAKVVDYLDQNGAPRWAYLHQIDRVFATEDA